MQQEKPLFQFIDTNIPDQLAQFHNINIDSSLSQLKPQQIRQFSLQNPQKDNEGFKMQTQPSIENSNNQNVDKHQMIHQIKIQVGPFQSVPQVILSEMIQTDTLQVQSDRQQLQTLVESINELSIHDSMLMEVKDLVENSARLNPLDSGHTMLQNLKTVTQNLQTSIHKLLKQCHSTILKGHTRIFFKQQKHKQKEVYQTVNWLTYLIDRFHLIDLPQDKINLYMNDFKHRFYRNQELTSYIVKWQIKHRLPIDNFVNPNKKGRKNQNKRNKLSQNKKSKLFMFKSLSNDSPVHQQQLDHFYVDFFTAHLCSTINSISPKTPDNLIDFETYILKLYDYQQLMNTQSSSKLSEIQQIIQNQTNHSNLPHEIIDSFVKSKISHLTISHILDRIGVQKYQDKTTQKISDNYQLKQYIADNRKQQDSQLEMWVLQNHSQILSTLSVSTNFLSENHKQIVLPQTHSIKMQFINLWKDQKQCEICLDFYAVFQFFTAFQCEHQFCYHCLSGHSDQKLKAFSQIQCPFENCKKHLDQQQIFYQGFTQEEKQKYERIQKLHFVNNDPFLKLCPMQGCEGIMPFIRGEQIFCPTCGLIFCETCLNVIHDGECEASEVEFLERNFQFKRCFQCRHVVEKTKGCNHMKCICKHEFCYICGQAWNQRHFQCKQGQTNPNTQQSRNNRFEENNQMTIRNRANGRERQRSRDNSQRNRRPFGSLAREEDRRHMGLIDEEMEEFNLQQALRASTASYYNGQIQESSYEQQMRLAMQMSIVQAEELMTCKRMQMDEQIKM